MNFFAPREIEDDWDRPARFHPSEPQDPFGLLWVWRTVLRRKFIIAGVATVVGAFIVVSAMLQPPMYAASSLVVIKPRQEKVVDPRQDIVGDLPQQMWAIASEIEIIQSRAVMGKLVDRLGLVEQALAREEREAQAAANPGAVKAPATSTPATPPSATTAPATTADAALAADPGAIAGAEPENSLIASADPEHVAALRENLVNRVTGAITVQRRGATLAIELGARSRDPETAALWANTLAKVYLDSQVEDRLDAARRANSWLSDRLDDLRADVQAKEAAVEAYRARTGLFVASGSSLSEQQLSNVQGTVLAARADLAEKMARYQQVQDLVAAGGSPDSAADIINSSSIADLRRRELDLARQIADLQSKYQDDHPTLQNTRAQKAELEQRIQDEMRRIALSLRNEVDVSRTRLRTLEGSLGAAEGQLSSNNEALVRLRELEREATAARNQYETYLARLQQISDLDTLNLNEAQIISEATVPRAPYAPNIKLALAFAIAAGLGAGLALAFLLELFDQTISTAEEIEGKLGVPALAAIPRLSKRAFRLLGPSEQNPAGYIVDKPMSSFAEVFRVLRTTIVYSDPDRRHRVIAFTSALPEEGKTTCAICLARVAATSGQKVLVVDCDLRRRSLNETLGLEPNEGLLQVLVDEAKWRDVVVRDVYSQADFLPVAHGTQFTARDVFGSDAMSRLVEDLRREYDLVIFDCPPVLAVAESRVIAALADATIVVAGWSKTPWRAVRSTMEQLRDSGARVMGVALNSVSTAAPGPLSLGDSMYYYRSNSKYYAQ